MSRQRRPKGTGGSWQGEDGRWYVQLDIGVQTAPDGTLKRVRKTGVRDSSEEAQALLDTLKARYGQATTTVEAGRRRPPDQERFAACFNRWLMEREALGVVRPKTTARARWARLHLEPTIGHLPLRSITPPVLRSLLARKRTEGLSPASLAILKSTVSACLKQVVQDGILTHNPARDVQAPPIPPAVRRPLSPAQVWQLVSKARTRKTPTGKPWPDPFWPLWVVALHHGLRPGELLGLQWADYDEAASVLTVRRQLEETAGGVPTFGDPKTAAGDRELYLEAPAVEALAWQREHRPPAQYDLIFCSRDGNPLRERNVSRAWKLALARAGLPAEVRLYDTRHSAATTMAAEGVDAATIAAVLGHADAAFSLRRYVKPLEGMKREAAKRVARSYGSADTQDRTGPQDRFGGS